MEQIRIGVIGVGRLGQIHARIYSQLNAVQLTGLCDIDHEKAKLHALDFKSTAYFDYRQLLGKVDAVSIATPTNEHFRVAEYFLKNRIHVLVEKPITDNITDAKRLIALAKRNKCILQVGHVERFNPAIKAVQSVCKNPHFIECHRLSPYPKRSTEISVVLDLMIHDLDIILNLVKSPLKRCDAIGVNVLSQTEDIANARLTFACGTVCNITTSRISDDVLRKIRIFEHNTYLSIDYLCQKITLYKQESGKITKRDIEVDKKEPLVEELQSFVNCIRKGEQPLVSGEDAKLALETALLITKQIRKNAKHHNHCR